MSDGVLALLSFLPILSVAILLVGLRWPASRALPFPALRFSSRFLGSLLF